jgi:hypothetical protein
MAVAEPICLRQPNLRCRDGGRQTLRFAWKLPCRVPVDERVERDASSMRFRFYLNLR